MSLDDRDKLNRIEELKTKLSSKNYQPNREHRDSFTHFKTDDLPDAWDSGGKAGSEYVPPKFFMKTSLFKKFFRFSLVFFGLTLLYGAYMLIWGGNTVSNENIDISVVGNNYTAGGEDLSLTISIANKNTSSLDLVDLVVEYPKDPSVGANAVSPTERSRISLGTIPSGAVRNENLKIILFGQQGSVVPIKISIEYRVEGSNAIFVKEKSYEVTISSTPINLSLDAPDTISPNQDLALNVEAVLNATKPAPKILVKMDYPVGFQFKSSLPAPTFGNNVWNLGDLAPGALRSISITGTMVGVFDGEEKTFRVSTGSQSTSSKSMIAVVFNSFSHKITIKKPSIEAKLFINGVSEREYAVDTKTPINANIEWANNSDTKINDLSIKAKISGNAVNRKTIRATQGFYNSGDDVITWDSSSIDALQEVNPGDTGSVNFSLSPLSLFSASNGLLNNPSIIIDISITGKQSVAGYTTEELRSSESSIIRLISDVGLAAKALYYSGPLGNTGPIPPKVDTPTTYTVTWSLSNTANPISKAVAHTTLPPWVRFLGPAIPGSEDLKYNASSREIFWNIGTIPKGAGITAATRSVSFQISLTPSLSQVNTTPILIRESVLTGHDDFANVNVTTDAGALNTILDHDPIFPPNGATVTE